MPHAIEIEGKQYRVIDAREITVPDCFVMRNKTGTAHGEAKFYVGNDNTETRRFFDDFSRRCFFLKSDFVSYMADAKVEYVHPQQPYRNRDSLPDDWKKYMGEIRRIRGEVIWFSIQEQTQITGPRLYINSDDSIYTLLRKVSLPNVTYLSALKLRSRDGELIYYFRLFIDYFGEADHPSVIKDQVQGIEEDKGIEDTEKEQIVRARKGQGEYRRKLLAECPFCPITLVSDDRLLVASHIKPWTKSGRDEKTDPKNGFMFTPTFDHLFDRGFISFHDDKSIIISPWLSKMTIKKLGLSPNRKYATLPVNGREKYLQYHRKEIFKA